jgi:hypothetical protein
MTRNRPISNLVNGMRTHGMTTLAAEGKDAEALVKTPTHHSNRLDTLLGWLGLLLIGIIGWTCDRFGDHPELGSHSIHGMAHHS